MEIQRLFALNVRELRRAEGLSQEELGILCGMDRSYVGNIEQNRRNPTLQTAARLADGLGVPPALLLVKDGADMVEMAGRVADALALFECDLVRRGLLRR